MNPKEPDKYSTIKLPINKILRSDMELVFNDAIIRTNKLVIHVYQFLRLWILHKYENKEDIPLITKDTIQMCFKALIKPSKQGRQPTNNRLLIFNEFNKFYEDHYKNLGYPVRINGKNLSAIIEYQVTDILTNIENNIKLNFNKYINKYVNASFYDKHQSILNKLQGKAKIHMRKELSKKLNVLKKDLMDNTITCDKEYVNWLIKHRHIILPVTYKESYKMDIIHNPQKYIPYMIKMNIYLEQKQTSQFQFFPLRTSFIPKYCMIDTKSLIELFITGKTKYLSDIPKYQDEVWEKVFYMSNGIFKRKNYKFDYSICTDGYAVSIRFIHKSFVEKQIKQKIAKSTAFKESIKATKNLSDDEKLKRNELIEKQKIDKKEKHRLEAQQKREEYKKLSKEEKKQISDKKKESIEFPYFEDLTQNQLAELIIKIKAYLDPGKRDLITIVDDKGRRFRYSNRQKLKETKQLKYNRLLNNFIGLNNQDTNPTKGLTIPKILNTFTHFKSKTCDIVKFKNYVSYKNIMGDLKLYEFYENEIFRKYKWYYYINKIRFQENLLKSIEKKFGKDIIIIYGDWSISRQMRNFISTPLISLKRKIASKFKVYNIDEYCTSCLSYKTEKYCDNIILPDKKGNLRKIHSILTYQMKNKRIGCINRDFNSVNNMKKLTEYYLKNQTRPLRYRRGHKLDEEMIIKIPNPNGKLSGKQSICASASNGDTLLIEYTSHPSNRNYQKSN